MKALLLVSGFCFLAMTSFSAQAADALPKGSKVGFVSPKDGATVTAKFTAKFSVDGLKIEKAGAVKPGTGHHHLIIDGPGTPAGQIVEKDSTHMHYGNGQTEAELTLTPGKHTLTLQFADGAHMSYGPEMSKTITITVK